MLSTQASQILREQMAAGSTAARKARRQAPAREPCFVSHGRPVQSRGLQSPANMSKRGLSARLYAPDQTLIMVNGRLPQGILGGGRGRQAGRISYRCIYH